MEYLFDDAFLNSLYLIVIVVFSINIAVLVFRSYIKKIFHNSKIVFDDALIRELMKPIYILSIFLIFYFLLTQIEYLQKNLLYLDRGIFAIMVGFLSIFFAKLALIFMDYWLRVKKKAKQTPKLLSGIVSALIYLSAAMVVLGYWGVQITPLVAALGVGGLAIGLGLQETLSNFFAGIHIVSDKPVRVGDYIEIGTDVAGTVEDIGWRSTRLKTPQNNVIVIPNSTLVKSVIVNITAESPEVSLSIPLGVAHASDLDKVERALLDEVEKYQKSGYLAEESTPLVRFSEFGESGINLNVIVRLHEYSDRFIVKHELIKAIKSRLDKEKIEI